MPWLQRSCEAKNASLGKSFIPAVCNSCRRLCSVCWVMLFPSCTCLRREATARLLNGGGFSASPKRNKGEIDHRNSSQAPDLSSSKRFYFCLCFLVVIAAYFPTMQTSGTPPRGSLELPLPFDASFSSKWYGCKVAVSMGFHPTPNNTRAELNWEERRWGNQSGTEGAGWWPHR